MNIVIIPCYKVRKTILKVINDIPNSINKIIIVDDKCPDETGKYVLRNNRSKKIHVIINKKNLGVGGAMIKGYFFSKKFNPRFIFKVDGDNQISSKEIKKFLYTLKKNKNIDCVKGNRFSKLKNFQEMPYFRLYGNKIVTLIGKIITGYYNINDFTNGFFCISGACLNKINLNLISKDFFFENDMMLALSSINANVVNVPTYCTYKGNKSNLKIYKIILPFISKFLTGYLNKNKFRKNINY